MGAAIALGVRLLAHDPRRLVAISISIALGVIVMFAEIGLLQGILDAQSMVATLARGDLLEMNWARVDLHRWDKIPRFELAQIGAVPGVAKVTPVYEDHLGFEDPDDNRVRRIIVYAFSPNDFPLAIGDRDQIAADLRSTDGFVFDTRSRQIFGKIARGQSINIDKWPLTVSGFAKMGPDIVNDGAIFMSEGEWRARRPGSDPIMGVVRLAPGASLEATRQRIIAQTPGDVAVLTPTEARQREDAATLKAAPIGLLFGLGALAGMVIGAVNGYQVLYTQVNDQLSQYATLKAMGFSELFLGGAVIAQAITISVVGFAIGLPTSMLADAYVGSLTRLPIEVHLGTAVLVLAATLISSLAAGRLAMRRVDDADPASLY
jgi:putative ABC transport system permease protein